MKDLLLITSIFAISFICLCLIKEFDHKENKPTFFHEETKTLSPTTNILDLINENRSIIKSVKSNYFLVHNKIGILNINSSGFLAYEKDKNFRLIVNSVFGKEIDIGSNDEHFWYWAKRSTEKSLFFSSYKNLSNTRLKDPVNPLVLKSILFIDVLPIKATQVYETTDNFFIEWPTKSIDEKENMSCCIKINKKTHQPSNMVFKNSKNKTITEATVLNSIKYKDTYLAQKIKISWPDENIEMTWELKDVEINSQINSSYWKMPNHDHKVDIGIN